MRHGACPSAQRLRGSFCETHGSLWTRGPWRLLSERLLTTQSLPMPIALVIRVALRALARHRLRSVLSTLGIGIGVGAFICSVAVGHGAARQIEAQIRSLGENFIWIEAGNRNVNGVRTGTHGTQSLTVRDMHAIQQQLPLLAQVSPNVDMRVQVISR